MWDNEDKLPERHGWTVVAGWTPGWPEKLGEEVLTATKPSLKTPSSVRRELCSPFLFMTGHTNDRYKEYELFFG